MRALLPSGNVPTTRVRLLISRLRRSIALFVRIRFQCSAGKRVYASVSAYPSRSYTEINASNPTVAKRRYLEKNVQFFGGDTKPPID